MKVQEFFDVQAILFNVYGLEDCARKTNVNWNLAPHGKSWEQIIQNLYNQVWSERNINYLAKRLQR